ncbi:hypothetical protein G9A89_017428 [Geosiphon pyriformis]|nr:hypothetical protein G9A89_017428 [Geosiphon pyriformis]
MGFNRNNILYQKNKRNSDQLTRVITEPEKETIPFNMHSDPTAEYFYKKTTMERTRKRYYWPSMYPNIIQYVQNCDACQRKGETKPSEPLRPIKTLENTWRRAADNIQKSQKKQKERHDNQLSKKPVEFKIGDKVLLYCTKVEKQWSKKIDPK